MTAIPVSVIVASRGRPDALGLCITALGQLQYHPYEVIVVGDPEGLAAVAVHPLADMIKTIEFDEANLARARNLGLGRAAGEVVAFIDDDAIAEPGWLAHLMAPFTDFRVGAAGGYVIGRNGISIQWGARTVDPEGWHHSLDMEGSKVRVFAPPDCDAVRLEGTNMAVRRSVLVALNGFDEAFRYYMDDTDLSVRLARQDHHVAIVPQARVVHHQAPSDYRTQQRMPRTLHQIGASTDAFLMRHIIDQKRRPAALAAQRADQRQRLLRHMVAGNCVPEDVGRLLAEYDSGVEQALPSDLVSNGPGRNVMAEFRPLRAMRSHAPRRTLSGWAWRAKTLRNRAVSEISKGRLVEVFRLTPTALYHRRRYVRPGFWLQTGGLFGRSFRDGPLFQLVRFPQRVAQEARHGPLSRLIPKVDGS
jgi:GT2 family glycosyltransferase